MTGASDGAEAPMSVDTHISAQVEVMKEMKKQTETLENERATKPAVLDLYLTDSPTPLNPSWSQLGLRISGVHVPSASAYYVNQTSDKE
jgi:hypothetical protein